ncbi:MAG TPA: PorP/SprF family type IX secretion system membrane protein [Chitinophagaceae bacterium]|nr:MAG: membrane protein [Bacteroidetes bacterium OLB11]HMN33515.1 PorP/SprF family type IX secretion system membrane protein [Chitinophagaceae bacterium]
MNILKLTRKISLACALSLGVAFTAQAQDMHFSQFNGAPLMLNPALTGNFSGLYRVTGIFRNQWSSVTTPYVTFGGSIDGPIKKDIAIDDYLSGGLSIYNDRSGDGNLANLSTLASLAYHKFLGEDSKMSLSVGLQGGYTQKSIDLSRLYWQSEFQNGGFQPGTSGELINPKVSYFTANAGLSFGHAISEKIAYQIGIAGHNLNQPKESFLRNKNNEVGLGMRINGQLGAIIQGSDRLSIRPAFMYQTQTSATEMIAGTEFLYIVGEPDIQSVATGVFLGGWYRFGDATLITGGLEFKGFRLGFAYDYNMSNLKTASKGNGGFEVALRYIMPNPLDFAKRIAFPCSRF